MSRRARGWQLLTVGIAALVLPAAGATSQSDKPAPRTPLDPAPALDAMLRESWPGIDEEWRARLAQDPIQRLCTRYRNKPPKRVADAIRRTAQAGIVYPTDGNLIGDPKRGEAIAQSGYGLRFTDTARGRPNGGNCYACHRISKAEESYGTLGPDLSGFAKSQPLTEATARRLYEKIFNPHATEPCSVMPRFGANGVLSPDDIRHLVALVAEAGGRSGN
jgi:sulfur-oxidizing protein SoxX